MILYFPLFADANLESVVWGRLGRPQGRLTPGDVASLKSPSFYNKDIHSLAGIEYLTALQRLDLGSNQVVDLAPLTSLTNLQELFLHRNQIVDLSPLKQLTNLQELWLGDNQIEDLDPLITNAGLGKGDLVNLQNNPLSAQARNEQIPALKARGVIINY